jgi:hypothetical protein
VIDATEAFDEIAMINFRELSRYFMETFEKEIINVYAPRLSLF